MSEIALIFFVSLGAGMYTMSKTNAFYAAAEIFLLIFSIGVALKLAYTPAKGGAR
jgi:hypothetical protein